MVYPHYGWIIYSFYPERWWREEVAKEHLDECTDEELEDFLHDSRALIIHVLPEPDKTDIDTAAGLVSIQIYEAFMPYQFFSTCSLSACLLLSAFQHNY